MEHDTFERTDNGRDLETMIGMMMGNLSHDHFFEDFEDHIEWGGYYNFDLKDDDGLDGHKGAL